MVGDVTCCKPIYKNKIVINGNQEKFGLPVTKRFLDYKWGGGGGGGCRGLGGVGGWVGEGVVSISKRSGVVA